VCPNVSDQSDFQESAHLEVQSATTVSHFALAPSTIVCGLGARRFILHVSDSTPAAKPGLYQAHRAGSMAMARLCVCAQRSRGRRVIRE